MSDHLRCGETFGWDGADELRTLIAKNAELSDIFMRAFLSRRVAMISGSLGNVAVLGIAALVRYAAPARIPHP